MGESAGLPARVWGMLRRPAQTWPVVAEEPASIRRLFWRYIAPLALIGPVCGAIGMVLFGASIAGIHLKPSVVEIVVGAVLDYAFTLMATYLLALVVAALAPLFGGEVDRLRAVKLVAHAGTAVWVAGALALYPLLGLPVMVLGALYSLRLLYLGLPVLMDNPSERSLTYFAAILGCILLLWVGLRWAAGILF